MSGTLTTDIPRADLIDLVQGLSEFPARWGGEAERQWGIWETQPGVYSELTITAYSRVGTDEYRQDFDETTVQLKSTMTGLREFTLTVKTKSYDLGKLPADVLERIRIRLGMERARFVLQGAGLALVRALPIIPLPPEKSEEDNRVAYVAVMDIRFAYAVNEVAGDDSGGIIEQVNSGGEIPGTFN